MDNHICVPCLSAQNNVFFYFQHCHNFVQVNQLKTSDRVELPSVAGNRGGGWVGGCEKTLQSNKNKMNDRQAQPFGGEKSSCVTFNVLRIIPVNSSRLYTHETGQSVFCL